jgi:5-methylcytosine-specific restriction endonuclease McrA
MRHKATAHISWEFDHEGPDATKEAVKQLNSMLPGHVVFRIGSVHRASSRQSKIMLGVFKPEEVLPYLTNDDSKRDYLVGDKTYQVRLNSHRYFVFRTSLKCAACGLEGSKFILEQHEKDKTPHFNLYAEENGDLIMMTKDHILAKSKGGENNEKNYQTMCVCCNNLKANMPLTGEEVQTLRLIYNANRRTVCKKQLNDILNAKKMEFLSKNRAGQ